MAASVKQRLLNMRKSGDDFNFLLTRFAAERLLFRLAESKYGRAFVLKGAMLFQFGAFRVPHRPTHDLDLLGKGLPDISRLEGVFREVCQVRVVDDGLIFSQERVRGEQIRADDEYAAVRLHLEARMGAARIPLQVDVGFGDSPTPPPRRAKLATLLDFPAPSVLVYPWEAVVAEKFHAIVRLGMGNSRMKDYFDLDHLAATQAFEGKTLARAIGAAFRSRSTPLPQETPEGLCPTFGMDPVKQTQWRAFLRRLHLEAGARPLANVVAKLRTFLMPPAESLVERKAFSLRWIPNGPWSRE
jgi:predicted nucleotidyltransferase component of viral defense system